MNSRMCLMIAVYILDTRKINFCSKRKTRRKKEEEREEREAREGEREGRKE